MFTYFIGISWGLTPICFRQHDFHHLQTGQNTITGACVLREDDMAAPLTTDTAAVLGHILVDILIAYCSLGVADTLLIESLVQTEVGHNGRNHSVGQHHHRRQSQHPSPSPQQISEGPRYGLNLHCY